LRELADNAGAQFDPDVVATLSEVLAGETAAVPA
jgi:hypothetical protein